MPRKVLIVEDADVCVETLEIALLRLRDVSIESARSAEDAIAVLGAGEVCAMVTDIHLPRMDGFELIEQVRRNPRFRDLPIIVISGDTDPGTPDRLKGLGVHAYFPKPYSPARVRDTLERLIYV